MAKSKKQPSKSIQRPTSGGRNQARPSRSLKPPVGSSRQPKRQTSNKPRQPKAAPKRKSASKPTSKGRPSVAEWHKLIQQAAAAAPASRKGSKPSVKELYKLIQEAERAGKAPKTKSVSRKGVKKGKVARRKVKAPARLKDLLAEERRQYRNLYQQAYRLKQKIGELNMKKRGSKAKRSGLYKELIDVNRELKKLLRSSGMKVRKPEGVLRERETAGQVMRYTEVVWKFEPIFTGYVNAKAFDKIVFLNSGKVMYTSKHKPSTILAEYDGQREMAYFRVAATTPLVNVTEDYGNSTLSLEFVS